MNQDIDKTIKRIETDLEENEQSLPKSAPTQHGIDCPPSEMPLYLFEADCTKCNFKIRYEFSDDLPAYLLHTEAAAKHCERNRHKVKHTLIRLIDGYATHDEFVPSNPTWVRWLEKFDFVFIGCVVSIIFALFEGWRTLPLRLPFFVFGAWVGDWLYRKWIKPKLQKLRQRDAYDTE